MNMKTVKQVSRKFKSIKHLPEWLQASLPYHVQIGIIRSALGMTQTQLAKRIQSQQRAIGRIEKCEISPTIKTLEKVADQLNCELKVLLVPRKPIIDFLHKKAMRFAMSIIRLSASSSTLEYQKPSPKMVREEMQEMKEIILKKNRSILWEKQ